MTENQTTPPEVNAPEANTVPELTELPFLGQALVENAAPTFKAYGELVTKLNAGDNVDAMVKDAVANSTEDEVVKLRATIDRAEKAAAKAREQAEALVKPTLEVPTDEQIAEATTKLKGLMRISGAITWCLLTHWRKAMSSRVVTSPLSLTLVLCRSVRVAQVQLQVQDLAVLALSLSMHMAIAKTISSRDRTRISQASARSQWC